METSKHAPEETQPSIARILEVGRLVLHPFKAFAEVLGNLTVGLGVDAPQPPHRDEK